MRAFLYYCEWDHLFPSGKRKIKGGDCAVEERVPKRSWIQSLPNTNDIFIVHRKIDLKIRIKSQNNSKTKKIGGSTYSLALKYDKKPIINKVARYGHKDNVCSIELTRKKVFKTKFHTYCQYICDKGTKGMQWEKDPLIKLLAFLCIYPKDVTSCDSFHWLFFTATRNEVNPDSHPLEKRS